MKSESSLAFIVVLIVVAVVIFVPFAVIWSLNILFPVLSIPYTIETWLATIVLSGVFKTTITSKK